MYNWCRLQYSTILPILCFLAKLSMLWVGSDPIDNSPTNGVLQSLSSQTFSTSNITPSAYLSPRASWMYLRAIGRVRSGSQLRTRSKRWKRSKELLYPSGITSSSGASLSNHVFHCFSFLPTYSIQKTLK